MIDLLLVLLLVVLFLVVGVVFVSALSALEHVNWSVSAFLARMFRRRR